MNSAHLNEHDANQGAQSTGEFLGMTGNSGWYLLGSGGATVMMVIVLWGVLGVSLLLCLFIGLILSVGAIAYVFTLKNNRPEHFDTDFFESALMEAGVVQFSFGPRVRRPVNPFGVIGDAAPNSQITDKSPLGNRSLRSSLKTSKRSEARADGNDPDKDAPPVTRAGSKADGLVPRSDYDQLQEKLTNTEEMLEDALAETAEE